MIESQILYRIFTRFATALGVLNGLSLKQAKSLTMRQLEKHSGKAQAKAIIGTITTDESSRIEQLLNECI